MAQLSIIIPVYRVEQTLDRCVRSVLCCERRDIEVLLVDDGSPDSCGTLCDQWATRDGRVRVLHKRNGGLSDARNAGIEASHGDLLMFVDSDDELAPGTIEAAMKTMEEDEACDIAEFGVLRVSRSSDDKEERACSKPVDGSCSNKPLFLEGELVFDPQTVSETHYVDMRLYWLRTRAYTHSYAWNKIYRRWLFQDVRYPVGRVFEDMFTPAPTAASCQTAAHHASWLLHLPHQLLGHNGPCRPRCVHDRYAAHGKHGSMASARHRQRAACGTKASGPLLHAHSQHPDNHLSAWVQTGRGIKTGLDVSTGRSFPTGRGITKGRGAAHASCGAVAPAPQVCA